MTRDEICRDCERHDITEGRDSCELIGAVNDAGKIVPSCCQLRRMWADESAACPLGKWNGAALVPLPVVQAQSGPPVPVDALTTLVRLCLACANKGPQWQCPTWNATNIKSLVQSGLVPDGQCPRYVAKA